MPISARELRECIKKLQGGKDITKKDIPKIISPCRLGDVKIGPDLMQAYKDWFKAVAERLPEFGNYARTVPVCSFLLRNFNLDVIRAVSECLDKMTPLDRATCVEVAHMPAPGWTKTSTERPTLASIFKFAGDLRSSDIYERISGMVPLFDGDLEERYGIPEYDLNGNCSGINVQTLYVQSILSVAYRNKTPLVRITAEDVRRQKKSDIVLVDPSDRKKLEYLLSFTPDEVFDIFSQNPKSRSIPKTTRALRQAGRDNFLKIVVLDARRIFDETGMAMERYGLLKERHDMADDGLLEIER